MKRGGIILLEFNELCPALLQRWMAEGQLPHFKQFYDSSDVFTATADEQNPDCLEPWIQWYSLHTGLSFGQHRVFHLTDGACADHDDLWSALRRHGHSVMNFGSMNARGFSDSGSVFLPDPWCTSQRAFPPELQVYQDVISTLVQENSASTRGSVGLGGYIRFAKVLLTRGLSQTSARSFLRQILSELATRGNSSWKRVPLMDLLQFDLFRHYWIRTRPSLATFFLNSTAHYQHAYWHLLFPEEFAQAPDEATRARLGGAILHGYRCMDRLLARFFQLETDGAMLVLCGALSQQSSGASGQDFYRLRDVGAFLDLLGVAPTHIQPVMAQQYMLRFSDASSAAHAIELLRRVTVNGRPAFDINQNEPGCVFFGCGLHEWFGSDATLSGLPPTMDAAFDRHLYRLSHAKSGDHHPDSILWVKAGQHAIHSEKVSILDVFPTLLEYFGVSPRVPTDPAARPSGRSLLPRVRSWSNALGSSTATAAYPIRAAS